MLIDMHCHLDLMSDMRKIICEIEKQEIGVFAVGTTPLAYQTDKDFCRNAMNAYVALGLHPQLAGQKWGNLQLFLKFLQQSRYVGEIGLDFNKKFIATKDTQLWNLDAIFRECKRIGGKVISIHAVKAVSDVNSLIEQYDLCCNNICIYHWYTGTLPQLSRAVKMGCYFSVNPKMMNTKSGTVAIRNIPNDRLLVESDAPYAYKVHSAYDLNKLINKCIYGISTIKGYDMRQNIERNSCRILSGRLSCLYY
ncbi:MAG: TatD family hydrolase [Dialister sp.]|nr:TatD family hydrolase [Dialister sp.]MDY5545100.1 Qat anti-phage system TatD family nuclease QatD [Dialister sp.]